MNTFKTLLLALLIIFTVNSIAQTTHQFYVTSTLNTPGVFTVSDTVIEIGDQVQFINSYNDTVNWTLENNGTLITNNIIPASIGSVIVNFTASIVETRDVLVMSSENDSIFQFIHLNIVDPNAVSVIENRTDMNFAVFPNPTNGNFSIDLGNNYEAIKISITDLSGRLIQSSEHNHSGILNLEMKEPSGFYFLTIESPENRYVIRLVKQ